MEIKIIETSDMHGYVLPTNYTERNMDLGFSTAKAATVIHRLKEEAKGPVIQIENGDFIQGSPLSYYVRKQDSKVASDLTKVLNYLNYDLGILGNHEFNYGLDYLREAIASYNHPILCSNILTKDGKPAFGEPYKVFEKDGVKIAVLGITTPYIPNWEQPATVKDLVFVSALETAKKYVPEMRKVADVVVVTYHGGFECDLSCGDPTELLTGENEGYAIATQVEGIDALVTGHQHRVIAQKVNGVPVIQPGYRGAYVGEISLEVEKVDGKVTVVSSEAKLHPTEGVPADPAVLEMFSDLQAEVEDWLDTPVGKVVGDMTIKDPHAARLSEHPYIEFINKVQMEASGADISGTALFNNDGRGFNSEIRMRDVITNYIYPNTLAVLKVSGEDLRKALERVATYFIVENGQAVFNPKYVEPKPQFYNYDMYEGIEYTLDFTRPFGDRVTRLEYHGKPVQDTDELEVVTNQYRAVGGGNYSMFKPEKIVREVQIDMTELIAEYLRKHPVIEATVNNNFKTVVK